MIQLSFTTNIEKRMPDTGKVFCIDRMTSDYTEQHPLDVDGYIESVYQEFAGTEFEESRETLWKVWNDTFKMPIHGDASLYPNKNGAKRAAAMKVWSKAGEYWCKGLRQGDTLPDRPPMCKITRLDDGGWIALSPKDAELLKDFNANDHELTTNRQESEEIVITESRNDEITTEQEPVITESQHHHEPRQLDLFAQLHLENEALQARIAEMERQEQERQAQEARDREARRLFREQQEETARQRRLRHEHEVPEWKRKLDEQWRVNHPYERLHAVAATVPGASESGNNNAWLKLAGYAAAASVALLLIWKTGLIIPTGLFGLAMSGFLK